MSDESEGGYFILVFSAFFLGLSVGTHNCNSDGQKAGDCYANNTCMPGLVCLHGDGHEPGTCVASPDGGAR